MQSRTYEKPYKHWLKTHRSGECHKRAFVGVTLKNPAINKEKLKDRCETLARELETQRVARMKFEAATISLTDQNAYLREQVDLYRKRLKHVRHVANTRQVRITTLIAKIQRLKNG